MSGATSDPRTLVSTLAKNPRLFVPQRLSWLQMGSKLALEFDRLLIGTESICRMHAQRAAGGDGTRE